MHDAMQSFVDWLGATPVSGAIAASPWMFPTGEILHFIGLAMLVGFVAAIDLRMLGVGRQIPLHDLHRLLPFGAAGFGLTLVTGLLFIVAAPEQYLLSSVFWAKIVFIGVAGVNVLAFYGSGVYEAVKRLGPGDDAPGAAKAIAATSLFLWAGVMFWGRMLPFLGTAF